jgi:hypothetical protein
MKRHLLRLGLSMLGLVAATIMGATSVYAADYSNSHLMDDPIFDNVNSMSEQQIRDFINSRPTSCLATSGAIFPEPITYWQYGGNVDAARVIYNAAHYNDLNPQVILATLQKEQTLITRTDCGTGGVDVRNKGMGMGCFDGQPCPTPAYAGFHQQVMKGAWALTFARQRAVGNVDWGDNGSIVYGGPWTEGNRAACSTCTAVFRDGYWNLDGQSVKMETGATAALYRYTPHLGQSFPSIFEGWFGSVVVPTYGSAYAGQSAYPTIVAGQTATVAFSYRNAGNQPWYDDTTAAGAGKAPLHLATSHAMNRGSVFGSPWGGDRNRAAGVFAAVYESDGVTLAGNQHVAQPGQIAKFSFPMASSVLTRPGVYREFFQPIIEGVTVMNDPWTFLDVTVQAATLTSQYVDQSPYPALLPGEQATAWFKYKNTGNQTWYDDASAPGANSAPIRLATSHNINRSSAFGVTWGGDRNRATGLFSAVYEADGVTPAGNQHVAQPGQIVKISFVMTAPTGMRAGTYREFFQPIVEGVTVMNDPWTFLDITVKSAYFASAYVGQAPYPAIPRGQQVTSWFMYKNIGTLPWYDDSSVTTGRLPIHLATGHPINRRSLFGGTWGGDQNRASGMFAAVYEADGVTLAGNQHVVQPGQIGKINFVMKAPANAQPGVYREFFQPIVEGTADGAMNDPWTFLDVTVQ